MPVPFTTLAGAHGYGLATGTPLPYADAAAQMFDVINSWASIEMQVGLLIAKVVGADPAAATAMYQAASGADQKGRLLRAAMSVRMPRMVEAIVLSTLAACEPSKDVRNSFAHDLWGFLTPQDGRLVSMSAKAYSTFYARAGDVDAADLVTLRAALEDQITVWTLEDLRQASAEARECYDMVGGFSFLINHPATLIMRSRLVQHDAVRTKLERRIKRWDIDALEADLREYHHPDSMLIHGLIAAELARR